jgi:hypothetical protein
MGTHFTLARLVPKQKITREPKPHRTSAISAVVVGPAIVVGIAVALCTYVYKVNATSTSSYVISHVQSQIANAQSQYQKLEVQAAQLDSLQRTETDPSVVSMVPVDTVTYIQTNAVAIR